jgi:hypothetical protein
MMKYKAGETKIGLDKFRDLLQIVLETQVRKDIADMLLAQDPKKAKALVDELEAGKTIRDWMAWLEEEVAKREVKLEEISRNAPSDQS